MPIYKIISGDEPDKTPGPAKAPKKAVNNSVTGAHEQACLNAEMIEVSRELEEFEAELHRIPEDVIKAYKHDKKVLLEGVNKNVNEIIAISRDLMNMLEKQVKEGNITSADLTINREMPNRINQAEKKNHLPNFPDLNAQIERSNIAIQKNLRGLSMLDNMYQDQMATTIGEKTKEEVEKVTKNFERLALLERQKNAVRSMSFKEKWIKGLENASEEARTTILDKSRIKIIERHLDSPKILPVYTADRDLAQISVLIHAKKAGLLSSAEFERLMATRVKLKKVNEGVPDKFLYNDEMDLENSYMAIATNVEKEFGSSPAFQESKKNFITALEKLSEKKIRKRLNRLRENSDELISSTPEISQLTVLGINQKKHSNALFPNPDQLDPLIDQLIALEINNEEPPNVLFQNSPQSIVQGETEFLQNPNQSVDQRKTRNNEIEHVLSHSEWKLIQLSVGDNTIIDNIHPALSFATMTQIMKTALRVQEKLEDEVRWRMDAMCIAKAHKVTGIAFHEANLATESLCSEVSSSNKTMIKDLTKIIEENKSLHNKIVDSNLTGDELIEKYFDLLNLLCNAAEFESLSKKISKQEREKIEKEYNEYRTTIPKLKNFIVENKEKTILLFREAVSDNKEVFKKENQEAIKPIRSSFFCEERIMQENEKISTEKNQATIDPNIFSSATRCLSSLFAKKRKEKENQEAMNNPTVSDSIRRGLYAYSKLSIKEETENEETDLTNCLLDSCLRLF